MLKYLVALLFVIQNFATRAQSYHPFIDTNKVWSVVEGYSLFTYNTYYYKLKGDTTINNTTYKKMLSTIDSNLVYWQYIAALREDSLQRVYISQYNQPEKLLYNFNLQIGDTVQYSQICNLVLNTIDSVQLINGEFRKRYLFFNSPSYQWIEGIGSEDGPLYIYVLGCDVDFNAELNCFTENDTLKYKSATFNSCYFSNTALHENKNDYIAFSPNPADAFITLNTEYPFKNGFISIKQLDGTMLLNESFKEKQSIDISNLHSGLYLLYFYDNGFVFQVTKLIILH